MKKDTHPEYREVVFLDMSSGKKFLCRSSVETSETVELEGMTYPCYKVSISSDSHPFYTDSEVFVDTEGRVDKFKKRFVNKPVLKKPTLEEKMASAKPVKKDVKKVSRKKQK